MWNQEEEPIFPYLDLTIMPKKGRVAMWANVLDEDPMEEHLLARHQALPVESGEKVGLFCLLFTFSLHILSNHSQ